MRLLAAIWKGSGRGSVWTLFWALVRIAAGAWLCSTAGTLARFDFESRSAISLAAAILGLLVLLWGVWGLVRGVVRLGARGVLLAVLAAWILIAGFRALTLGGGETFGSRMLEQLAAAPAASGKVLAGAARWTTGVHDAFALVTGSGPTEVRRPPGFPAPTPGATPVRVVAQPAQQSARAAASTALQPGAYARVVLSGRADPVLRSAPGPQQRLLGDLPTNARVLVLAGPRVAGAVRWWKVYGEAGEGWCEERFLTPTP